uniref:Capsid n=1 Tax=Macaque picobirnavirus 4 TaxID=2078820 RepID=A0A2L1FE60_9VIRU|nr:capsid [Macaque picobirnavirus 4]
MANNNKKKNGGRKNGKRRNSNLKDYSTFEKESNENYKGKTQAKNDLKWYGKGTLLKDAASFSFPTASGRKHTVIDLQPGITVSADFQRYQVYPGIMELDMINLPGSIGSWHDPVNVMIRKIYSFIRHQNSGSKNYDAADLGVYFQVYDNAVSFYAYMVRLYGTLRSLIVQNSYTPQDLVTVMGADYTDLVANMAAFRAYINTYAVRLAALKVPSNLHFIERHMWLYSNIFADAPTPKAQMYIIKPAAFWEYTVGSTPETTKFALTEVVPACADGSRYTYERLRVTGDRFLNSVLNNEDFNIMSGDIIKAYGDQVFTVNMINEDYLVTPVYEPEVLFQLHNATLLPCTSSTSSTPSGWTNWTIKQDYSEDANVGALVGEFGIPMWSSTVGNQFGSVIKGVTRAPFDVPTAQPDHELCALGTRMMVVGKVEKREEQGGGKLWYFVPTAYGTEICVGALVYKHQAPSGILTFHELSFNEASAFSVYPLLNTASGKFAVDAITVSNAGVVGNIDNITWLTHDEVARVHEACLLGVYGLDE